MALKVVESACKFAADYSSGTVVIESDCEGPPFTQAFHELDSADARRVAQGYAGKAGLGTAHINGNVIGPYPVNSEGLSLEEVRDSKNKPLPANHARMQAKSYRIDVPVTRPFH